MSTQSQNVIMNIKSFVKGYVEGKVKRYDSKSFTTTSLPRDKTPRTFNLLILLQQPLIQNKVDFSITF